MRIKRKVHAHRPALALCAVAGLAFTAALHAKDPSAAWDPAAVVDFYATVDGIREVPAGRPMPGIHLDVKVKGRVMDIYVAPTAYLEKYEMTFSKGEDVHVVGSRTRSGQSDLVLAREVSVGASNKRTLYLRNEDGPFWEEDAAKQSAAATRP